MKTMTKTVAAAMILAVYAASALTPDEAKKLTQENEGRAQALMRQIANTCSRETPRSAPTRIGTAKNFDELRKAADELDGLVALKEGAPANCTAATSRHLLARAYSEPLNLRFTKEARAEFKKALALAKTPEEKARIGYDYAAFEYAAAEDDRPEAWEKAMVDAYLTPDLPPAVKLDLLALGVPGKDFEKDGWEAVKGGEVRLRARYFSRLLWHTNWQTPSYALDRTNTPEYWLEVCDRAIADLGKRDGADFVARRREYLRLLGRGDEVERALVAETLTVTNQARLSDVYYALARHYEAMAKRYYANPDADVMRKALQAMRSAYELRPDGYRREYANLLLAAKDYRGVVELVGPRFDPQKPDPWNYGTLGDAYYYLGEWEKAVAVYDSLGEKMPQLERNPPNRWDRKANALYVLGRYEECLKTVDKLSDWLVWKDRKAAYRLRLKKLIEAQKAQTN